jgi:hypothetical protein
MFEAEKIDGEMTKISSQKNDGPFSSGHETCFSGKLLSRIKRYFNNLNIFRCFLALDLYQQPLFRPTLPDLPEYKG